METCCSGCGRHCPVTALSCERGRMLCGQESGPEAYEGRCESRGHGHGGGHGGGGERHGKGRWHGEGHGPGHWHGEGRTYGHLEPHDDGKVTDLHLAGLLRTCGHTLYHMGSGRNGQLRLLGALSRHGEMSQRELTECLNVQSGSMSELLSKLEQRGLVERAPMESDRRTFSVRMTEAGREEMRALNAQYEQAVGELFTALKGEEKEALAALLEKLTLSWHGDRGGAGRSGPRGTEE